MADGSARIELPWGGDMRVFRLGLKELRELQYKTGAGPEALYRRIRAGEWHVDDLRETLRLGLLGAGMETKEVIKLLVAHFPGAQGLAPHKEPAAAVLLAALVGPADDPAGKAGRGGKKTKETAAASPSPSSSGTQLPSE